MPSTGTRGRTPVSPADQINPSVTSPRHGARGRNKSPLDLTGRRHEELVRAKQARDAAQNVDLGEVKRQARAEGFDAGWDAAIAWVVKEYGLDADEDQADAEAAQ